MERRSLEKILVEVFFPAIINQNAKNHILAFRAAVGEFFIFLCL
jgi:hypothetical protein